MAQKDADLQKIKKIIEIMKNNDLVEVEIKHADDKILLKRAQPPQTILTTAPALPAPTGAAQAPAAQAGSSEPAHNESLVEIKSLMVGTFYTAPSPDSDPYVEIDTKVEPQTVVCIIEAMKVMNEIKAGVSGTIVEILVPSGQAVEYDQVLFRVKPD